MNLKNLLVLATAMAMVLSACSESPQAGQSKARMLKWLAMHALAMHVLAVQTEADGHCKQLEK